MFTGVSKMSLSPKLKSILKTVGNFVSTFIAGKTPVYAAAYNGHTTTINGVDPVFVTVSNDSTSSVVVNR